VNGDVKVKKKYRSLKSRIILLILCGILASTAILATISIGLSREASAKSAVSIMKLTCEKESEGVTTLLEDIEHLTRVAADYARKNLKGAYVLKDARQREQYYSDIEYYFDEIALSTDGCLTYYFRPDPDIAGSDAGFLYIYDADSGKYVQDEVTDLYAYEEDDERVSWFFTARMMGMPTWIRPYNDIHDTSTVISYTIPIYVDNTFIGITGMDVDFNQVADRVESITAYDSGYAFLCGVHGEIYVHKSLAYGETIRDIDGLENLSAALRQDSSGDALIDVTFDGTKCRAAFTTLINGMKLVLIVPESEIFAGSNTTAYTLGLAMLLIAVLFITISVYMTRKITGPLNQLVAAAKRIHGGDMNVQLAGGGSDEIGELTAIFRSMISQLSLYIRDVRRNAYIDALTGIMNSTAYDSSKKNLNEAISYGDSSEFAIAVLDVNNLKFVNDTYGHDCGDTYIRKASQLVCEVFRNSPVYRFGGDEFIAVLKNHDYEHRDELAEKLAAEMRIRNAAADNEWEKTFIAVGISAFDPEKDSCVDDIFKRADELMYRYKTEMKKAGRRPV